MERTHRYWLPRLATLPALFSALGLLWSPAQGQGPVRFAVLVPPYTSQTDAKSRFGRNLAKEIGKLVDELPTHRLLDDAVLKDALRKNGIKEEDLSAPPQCIKARQLAILLDVNLVMCGTFEGSRDDYTVKTQIIAPAEDESYDLGPVQANDPEAAARVIVQEFQGWIEGLQVQVYCRGHVESENWPAAIETCTRAVAATPSKGAIYMLAFARWKSGATGAAYDGFRRVLELDPRHQQATKMLGILAAQLGDNDEAMQYFNRYMEYNPGDRHVRLTVAADAANAGQYEAALEIVEAGLEGEDVNNADLLSAAGVYAMNAANQLIAANGGAMTDTARPLFDKSLDYLHEVYGQKGTDLQPGVVRNMIQANRIMDRDSAAIAFSEQVLADPRFANDADLWSVYADALNDAGRRDDAFTALDKVVSLAPDHAVNGRRAFWLLDAGDVDGAVPAIRTALQKNEITAAQADVLAQKIAVAALGKVKAARFQAAIDNCDLAAPFATSGTARTLLAYVKGYSLYSIAARREEPQTLETARATLPMFREVLRLMNEADGNPDVDRSRREVIEKTNVYIEIQQAIIKRHGGG